MPGFMGACLLVMGLVVLPAQPWEHAFQLFGIGPLVHGFSDRYQQGLDKVALAMALLGLLAAILVPLLLRFASSLERRGTEEWLSTFAALSVLVYLVITYRGSYVPNSSTAGPPLESPEALVVPLLLVTAMVLLLVQALAPPPSPEDWLV